MTKGRRKSHKRQVVHTQAENITDSSNSSLFPHLNKLIKEVTGAQKRFDRLVADNENWKQQLEEQEKKLGQTQQQATDLKNECQSLKQKLHQAEEEIQRSEINALVSLFKDMADERNNRLLRKLLAFHEDEPKLLYEIVRYLRENTELSLNGEVDKKITLTNENIDHYEIQENVTLPCDAQIIGRGVSFQGQSILRIQVELLDDEVEDKENTNHGN